MAEMTGFSTFRQLFTVKSLIAESMRPMRSTCELELSVTFIVLMPCPKPTGSLETLWRISCLNKSQESEKFLGFGPPHKRS